ncbi:hypothetical protein [Photobacterium alginatilyticum]|uniref:Sulfotransferase domain-containing protein n=1 Tax=Photobacterium alginatilyticum TaxID=1775171 RepID=A0ABW9YCX3_9GAMM|nr:hypothetical protein [Photobacterium alginatilyticum]NBI51612.1 hypothetical protein [Photobacterium alginatilyticum]
MIYLHIGLPKTATSSLQEFLYEESDNCHINYLGVNQPRGQGKEHHFYTQLICFMNSQTPEELSKNLDVCRKTLTSLINGSQTPLFLSEEMLTVDNLGITWQMKIDRLSMLLSGIQYKIIVTTREPVSALHSFYTEIYHDVKLDYPSLSVFCESNNNAKIYDYNNLRSILNDSFDMSEVVFFPFEGLIKKNGIQNFLSAINVSHSPDSSLIETNTKKKTSNGSYTRKLFFREKIDKLDIAYSKKEKLYRIFGECEIPFSSKFIKKLSGDKLNHVEVLYKSELY